jgi:hypothetical protein
MKTILYAYAALALGCASVVKPLELKPLEPTGDSQKIVMVNVPEKEMHQFSCTGRLYGELYQKQGGQWIRIQNKFDPSDSHTAFYLDGKFSESTMVGFGCDEVICKIVTPLIRLNLTKYQELGEKLNPLYAKHPNSKPKMIPNYKTNLLSGHFKTTYEYYTDPKCDDKSHQEQTIEFDVL